jgi:hypothetical protein
MKSATRLDAASDAAGGPARAEMHGGAWRPWSGERNPARFRAAPIVRAGLRIALRKKLPLVLLFLPPVVATIIFSFVVYTVAALAQGMAPAGLGAAGGTMGQALGGPGGAGDFVKQLVRVREMIVGFHLSTDFFSVLLMAWFGAGLLAEDKKSGAHLLYFARPLTRVDYLLGKFCIVALFGVLGSILPGLVIITVAVAASPDWSFLQQEGSVVWKTFLFGGAWTIVVSSLVLAVSSLATRKSYALAGVFAWFMFSGATALLLSRLLKDRDWLALSPVQCGVRIAEDLFDMRLGVRDWNTPLAWTAWGLLVLVSWTIIWWRTRRLEVV